MKEPVVYVSCFPDRTVVRTYLTDLVWETEAKRAGTPDHMVHMAASTSSVRTTSSLLYASNVSPSMWS